MCFIFLVCVCVCKQEVLIGQLQRKLTELSLHTSPAVGPANPVDGEGSRAGSALDMESLGLSLAALQNDISLEERETSRAAHRSTIGDGATAAVADVVP